MLSQAVHVMQIVGTIADGLLLWRVLALKLHRVYAFFTLYCVLELLFDVAAWWLGWESAGSARLYFYSRYLYAALFPAMAWDIFEEISPQIAKIRRLPTARLISGLFVTGFFACLMLVTVQSKDLNAGSEVTDELGVFLWAGACSASLVFVWSLFRATRAQRIELPNNTSVWFLFFMLTLIRALAECGFALFGFKLSPTVSNIVILFFLSFDLALTAWCILRLKAVPSTGGAPEKISL
ncbi:MAG: hypothetical protein JOY62_12125 [Acidobacteriaceae bacterium]|nr:hypothetical protein [Acidobacteriaceae bacterium]MBV9780706.1 hypothetical protein [Acidobacteriaceae bacterium]